VTDGAIGHSVRVDLAAVHTGAADVDAEEFEQLLQGGVAGRRAALELDLAWNAAHV